MKRKLLAFIGIMLMCSFSSMKMNNIATPIFAEVESSEVVESSSEEETPSSEATFVEKTYVYEDENGKATLVLLSESEFSMTVGEETKLGTYTKEGNVVVLTIGENSLKVVINEILGTFGEYIEEEPIEEKSEFLEALNKKINELVHTFVVPLVTGLSLTNIISLAFTILFAFLNRRTNKNIKTSNDSTQTAALNCLQISENNQAAMLKFAEDIKQGIYDFKELVKELKKEDEDTAKMIDEKFEKFEKTFDQVIKYSNKLDDIRAVLIMLIQLQTTMASSDPKAISSGIVEQIEQLNEQAKKLL